MLPLKTDLYLFDQELQKLVHYSGYILRFLSKLGFMYYTSRIFLSKLAVMTKCHSMLKSTHFQFLYSQISQMFIPRLNPDIHLRYHQLVITTITTIEI